MTTTDVQILLAIVTLAAGLINAWQNSSIRNAVLSLKVELGERIGKTEADVKVLQTTSSRNEADLRQIQTAVAALSAPQPHHPR